MLMRAKKLLQWNNYKIPSDLFLLKKPSKSLDFRLFFSTFSNSSSHSLFTESSSGLLLEILDELAVVLAPFFRTFGAIELASVVGQKFGFHPSIRDCFVAESPLSGRNVVCGITSSERRFEPIPLLLEAISSPDIFVDDDSPPS